MFVPHTSQHVGDIVHFLFKLVEVVAQSPDYGRCSVHRFMHSCSYWVSYSFFHSTLTFTSVVVLIHMNMRNKFGILYYQTTKLVYVLTLRSLSIGCCAFLSKSNYWVWGLPRFYRLLSTPKFHATLLSIWCQVYCWNALDPRNIRNMPYATFLEPTIHMMLSLCVPFLKNIQASAYTMSSDNKESLLRDQFNRIQFKRNNSNLNVA